MWMCCSSKPAWLKIHGILKILCRFCNPRISFWCGRSFLGLPIVAFIKFFTSLQQRTTRIWQSKNRLYPCHSTNKTNAHLCHKVISIEIVFMEFPKIHEIWNFQPSETGTDSKDICVMTVINSYKLNVCIAMQCQHLNVDLGDYVNCIIIIISQFSIISSGDISTYITAWTNVIDYGNFL